MTPTEDAGRSDLVLPTDRAPSEPSSDRTFDVSVDEKATGSGPGRPAWRRLVALSDRRYLRQSALLPLERRLITPQARHLLQHTVARGLTVARRLHPTKNQTEFYFREKKFGTISSN